jgi:hypothetical protein
MREEQPKVENLELNKESLADLTEQESEKAEGGLVARPRPCMSCNDSCSPSNARL